MSITKQPNTAENLAAAKALPEPKHIVIDGKTLIVYTGEDVPPGPDPQEVKDAEDAYAARSYKKLENLCKMTPDEVAAWVSANVTTLAQARDAITTLAIAVSVLGRRL
ncbi:MAG TPA: hypothetical protein PKA84_08825 [Rubrivivax sp.]|nr:hypothetical protein [Rubrivivax sp.]HMR70324.1 hypothetical protein [Rubrivivax sp.]